MTLNQYVNTARNFASAHKLLNGFFVGSRDEFNTAKDQLYPVMLMYVEPTILETGTKNRKGFQAEFGFLDKQELDFSNRLEVQSNMEQIAIDWLATLNSVREFEISQTSNIDHYFEEYDDGLAGAYFSTTVYVFNNLNACAVPSSTAPSQAITGAFIRDKDTGTVIYTLYPNQYYDVEVLRQIIDTIDSNTVTIIDQIN